MNECCQYLENLTHLESYGEVYLYECQFCGSKQQQYQTDGGVVIFNEVNHAHCDICKV